MITNIFRCLFALLFITSTILRTNAQPSSRDSVANRALANLNAMYSRTDTTLETLHGSYQLQDGVIPKPGKGRKPLAHPEKMIFLKMAAVQVYVINFDKLREYNSGMETDSMIIKTHRQLYPVLDPVSYNLSTTLLIDSFAGKGWKPAGYGVDRSVMQQWFEVAKSQRIASASLVKIRELEKNFLGIFKDNRLFLVALQDDSAADIKQGAMLPLDTVVKRYAPLAKKYKGLR